MWGHVHFKSVQLSSRWGSLGKNIDVSVLVVHVAGRHSCHHLRYATNSRVKLLDIREGGDLLRLEYT